MKQHQLKELSGKDAKEILAKFLRELSGIDQTDMTTFELGVIRACATEPPKRHFGVENQINNGCK
jgi:hypothetical protein